MERRKELRFEANEPVAVTELDSGHRHHAVGGMIRDVSAGGMLMKLPHRIECKALVRVETSCMLLLGEVVRCAPEGESFLVGIAVRHSLQDLKSLDNLNRALLGPDRSTARSRCASPPLL